VFQHRDLLDLLVLDFAGDLVELTAVVSCEDLGPREGMQRFAIEPGLLPLLRVM